MRKPRPVYVNAAEMAIERSRKLPANDAAMLKKIIGDSFDALKLGNGRRDDMRNLIDAFNLAEELAELGICSDTYSKTTIENGQSALCDLYLRQQNRDSWTMRGEEIKCIEEAIFIHGVQLDYVSMGEYIKAQDTVKAKARRALSGNIPKGTKVLA